MASQHDDGDSFWNLFDLDEVPAFAESDDLSRFSVETHYGSSDNLKLLRSRGHLRLTGTGVLGHEADLSQVGLVASSFQKLVTALGSALSGVKNSISSKAEQLTRLRLDASPAPGSLVLNFVPATSPQSELRPRGELFDNQQQLLDRTFDALYPLLSVAGGINSLDTIAGLLRGYGPKTATALRLFAETTSSGFFDLDILWQEPLKPSKRMFVSSGDSKLITQLVNGRKLDESAVTLLGVLKTVSSSGQWEIADKDLGIVAFDISDLQGSPWVSHNPGDEITVDTSMSEIERPGRESSRSFRAYSVRRIEK